MLRVRLLGELEVELHGRRVEPPSSRRAWALLAWLALHPGEHPRSTVAARFWPDVLDTSARASLRSAAWALRKALGSGGDEALVATRDRVGLRCETDLREFDALVRAGELAEAVELCRGPLLADVDEDWAFEARDEHAERLGAVLARLADQAPTPAAAIAHARRRLALDPLDEAVARDLMARLADAGDRAGALSVYDRLTERLRTQLGLAASAETRAAAASLRAAPAHSQDGPGPLPLIGREEELRALDRAWSARAGAVVVLAGEPGIGKTRLAREALARARADGGRTAACASLELGAAAPFALWTELLRDLAATLPPPAPEAAWPEELGALAPSLALRLGRTPARAQLPVAPELARARLFEAGVDAVEHACADRPLALLFDDVHLADAASLEMLAYVLRRFAGLPVLAILTRRQTPEHPGLDAVVHAHRARGGALVELDLAPLSRSAVDELVGTVAALGADARDQVVAAADGNPLLAVEGARAAGAGHEGPPPSLRAVVAAAIGRLEPDARRASELAAVAGRHLAGPELQALTTADAVVAALDCGLFSGEDGRFGFRHALLRDAALAQLPDARRRARHEELAHALAGSAAEAAHHLRLGGRDDLAAGRLARAAEDALVVGAAGDAIRFLDEALELRPDDPGLLLDLAHAQAWGGRQPEAEEALERALERIDPGDHGARGRAHVRAAKWYSGALCHPRKAAEESRRALAELERGGEPDPRVLGSALALGAWGASVSGRPEDADAMLARLGELAHDDPELVYESTHAHAFRLLREERLDEALGELLACAELAGAAPDRAYACWVNLACIAGALGRFEEALAYAERGLRAVRGLPPLAAPLHAVRATLLARLDRLDEARAALAEERRVAERSGSEGLLALADHDEGLLAALAGEHARAAELLGGALERGAAVSRPLARLARAEALARDGRPDEADAELRAVTLEPVGPADRPRLLVPRLTHVQALAALARGDRALAARRLDEAVAAWRRTSGTEQAGELLANLVDLGRPSIGVTEPARELARAEAELRDLQAMTI